MSVDRHWWDIWKDIEMESDVSIIALLWTLMSKRWLSKVCQVVIQFSSFPPPWLLKRDEFCENRQQINIFIHHILSTHIFDEWHFRVIRVRTLMKAADY